MDSKVDHHKRFEYCTTRLRYRQGKELKAVKVYTVANESQNLLIFGVPKINLLQELKQRLSRFGKLEHARNVTKDIIEKELDLEPFTEVYWVKFCKIFESRKCKRFMDAREFYGDILHISYAPEYETAEELKEKILKRSQEVKYQLKRNDQYTKRNKDNNDKDTEDVKYC